VGRVERLSELLEEVKLNHRSHTINSQTFLYKKGILRHLIKFKDLKMKKPMTPEKLYQIVNEAPKFGKMAVIQDKDGYYCIFSTPDDSGDLRCSGFGKDLEIAKRKIGKFAGFTKDDFLERAKEENWQFHSYIDISEFFDRSGYEKEMKVRHIETGKIGIIKGLTSLFANKIDRGSVNVEVEDGNINHWDYTSIEPVHEDEQTIQIEGKEYTIDDIKQALNK